MNQRTLLYVVAAIVVILVLGYGLGWFGGRGPAPVTTTPPAATTPPPATTTTPPAATTTPPATGTGTGGTTQP